MFVISDPISIIYYPDTAAASMMSLFEGYTLVQGGDLTVGTGWVSIESTLISDVLYLAVYRSSEVEGLLLRFEKAGPSVVMKYVDAPGNP